MTGPTATGRRSRYGALAGLVATVALVAGGISWVLLPANEELGLIDAEAGRIDKATERLEAVIAAGNNTPEGVAALARARLDAADVEGALGVLQALARRQPNDPNLQAEIAGIYRGLEIPEQEIRLMTAAASGRSDPAAQRRLVDLFDLTNDRAEARKALEAVVSSRGAVAADYSRLSHLYADDGDLETAIEVLTRAVDTMEAKDALDLLNEELALRLSLSQPQDELAERIADVLARTRAGDVQVATVLSRLLAAGYPGLVVDTLSQFDQTEQSAELMSLDIEAMSRLKRRADAMPVLAKLIELAAQTRDTATQLTALDSAATLEAWPQVREETLAIGLTQLPATRVGAAAAAAINLKDVAFARSIVAVLEMSRPWADPIVVAELHFVAGLTEEARQEALSARASVGFDTGRAMYLADLFLRLRMRGEASEMLDAAFPGSSPSLTWERSVTASSADDVVYLFLRLGRPEKGYQVLSRLKEVMGDPSYDAAWALAAAASDRTSAVQRWFREQGSAEMSDAYLKDLRSLAAQASARSLTVLVGKEVARRSGTDRDKLFVAGVLMNTEPTGAVR